MSDLLPIGTRVHEKEDPTDSGTVTAHHSRGTHVKVTFDSGDDGWYLPSELVVEPEA